MGLTFWVGLVTGQSVFSITTTPMCWITGGVDSTLFRYVLVGSRATEPTVMGYRNAAGLQVAVSGGRLYYGQCECCPRDTLPVPRIENYSEISPIPNPMDPGSLTVCYRGQSGYLFGVTDPTTQISVISDGSPLTYIGIGPAVSTGQWSYDPITKFFRALGPNYGTGSGPHTMVLTVTIPSGTLTRTLNFNCGS